LGYAGGKVVEKIVGRSGGVAPTSATFTESNACCYTMISI